MSKEKPSIEQINEWLYEFGRDYEPAPPGCEWDEHGLNVVNEEVLTLEMAMRPILPQPTTSE